MKTDWTDCVTPAGKQFMQEIIDQVPAMAQEAFVGILNKIAQGTPEHRLAFEKYQALLEAGVDEWHGYEEAMSEFEDDDEGDDE